VVFFIFCQTRDDLTKFVESLQLPTFHSLKSTSSLPSEHPLQCGVAWNLPGLKEVPDLVLLLGVRTGMFLGNRSGSVLPPAGTKFIQVDTDGSEIGKAQAIDLGSSAFFLFRCPDIFAGIVSDAHQFMIAFNAASANEDMAANKQWVETALAIKTAPHQHDNDPEVDSTNGRLHPLHAIRAVFKEAPKGSIVLLDGVSRSDASSFASNVRRAMQCCGRAMFSNSASRL
jgi:thiamine pyrophosphate-dependent acetolactate synthase large subunit-like protein